MAIKKLPDALAGELSGAIGRLTDITPFITRTLGTIRAEAGATHPEVERICLLVIDGFGAELLRAHRAHTPFFRNHGGATITATDPSTTVAGITAILTGQGPGQTGMLGYTTRIDGVVTSLITFGGGPDSAAIAGAYQPHPTVFEQLGPDRCVAVTKPAFANSGLTGAALRGARMVGAPGFAQRCELALRELRAGSEFCYLYWEGLDHIGHGLGPNHQDWLAQLEEIDYQVGAFAARLPAGTLLLITGDHGMVEVAHTHDIATQPWADEVVTVAGEGRAIHLFATPATGPRLGPAELATGADFARRIGPRLNGWGEVLTRAECAAKWGIAPADSRLPDLLVRAHGRDQVVDSRHNSAAAIAMRGLHGGTTPAEVNVPLIAVCA